MDYVIGQAIRKKIEEKGMTFVSFADKFGLSDRNLQYLFKKSDIPISQIIRASEILDYDFISEYTSNRKPKYQQVIAKQAGELNDIKVFNNISINLTISGPIDNFSKFPSFLQKLKVEAERTGFEIM